ncbi:MAG TPA: tetratricopeptide repeat protein [Bacteroidota bacterium]|nr:tetratricopeptide repeat protein [Bacteroidota bacterium]
MKKIWYSFAALACSLWLTGCAYTREPMHASDEFFTPVTSVPHRQVFNDAYSSSDLDQLRQQLAQATQVTKELRDSLTAMTRYAGSLLASTRTMMEKVSELESREYLALTRQKQLEENVEKLKSDNEKISKEMSELLASTSVRAPRLTTAPEKSDAVMLSDLRSQYPRALMLFAQKNYEASIQAFRSLVEKGIDEDLADNCIYWMGEGYFAKMMYKNAIAEFQKVLTIESSNKKADAYFMLGRSYEALGDWKTAQQAYEKVTSLFPQSANVLRARIRIKALQSHWG